ncbi:MAG: prepilin-type N-terminal cleavage/methylation domain-containing protein [Pirellulaceae bacterium]|nr:prepilin-type N-terminal cleavage/methylation domain-containing protein [Planctomycetales bacterium]
MTGRRRYRQTHITKGLSLLEVMLALAILGVAIAALGELVRVGMRSAEQARDITEAQLICEAKLGQLASGVIPLQGANNAAVEWDNNWVYSVQVQNASQQNVVSVTVSVQPARETASNRATVTQVQWMPNPSYAQQLIDAELAALEAQAAETTSP